MIWSTPSSSRARNYEEQGQFAEAITQWNTLANIHPQYPGIDFEISHLERRREQQAEEDKKVPPRRTELTALSAMPLMPTRNA